MEVLIDTAKVKEISESKAASGAQTIQAGLRYCQTPCLVGVARFYQIEVFLDGG